MGKQYILFNPYSSNSTGESEAKKVLFYLSGASYEFVKMTEVADYADFFKTCNGDDKIIVCGGDGTFNHFVNDCHGVFPDNEIYLYPGGSGNDFLNDINMKAPCAPVKVNEYLKNLPQAEVNGKNYFFINNIGFGIDGLVCYDAEELKTRKKTAKTNYTPIALQAILFKYKPGNAKVCVDGKNYEFERVWMAPTMNGRFFGGGMMVAPMQNRLNEEHSMTLMLFHNANRFQMATSFPAVFSGKHVSNPKCFFFFFHDITVEFDAPNFIEIDGEPIINVVKYHAFRK
ncbi:MAG: diacylglycerol kinase family protein [Lachnospiraceae bacterium]|nr:diacylglycerol kinase family protein [Lachnospiraceae bacterium]